MKLAAYASGACMGMVVVLWLAMALGKVEIEAYSALVGVGLASFGHYLGAVFVSYLDREGRP